MITFQAESTLTLCVVTRDDEERSFVFSDEISRLTGGLDDMQLTREPTQADIILIFATGHSWGLDTIRSLRSIPMLFLTPILLISEESSEELAAYADDTLLWPATQTALQTKVNALATIAHNVQRLEEIPDTVTGPSRRKILFLRFLLTRAPLILKPVRDFRATVGYTYPILQTLLEVTPGKELDVLDALEDSQLLSKKLEDRVNVCPYCQHTQINFRELCPHCNSIDIQEETTIHHYQCGYVGRETEFQKGKDLICPKCSRELRHIGVDYDKPAEILWCNTCKHNFSEPRLSCFCLNDAKIFEPEDAFVKNINEYTLSQEGYMVAEEGVLPGHGLVSILKKELGFYKREVFMEYVQLERSRCRRYKYESTLARFSLKEVNTSFSEDRIPYSRKLKSQIAAVVNGTFRTSDLFTDLANGDILALFTNTSDKRARIAFTRLNESLGSLLNIQVNIQFKLFGLGAKDDQLEEYLETIR